MPTFPLTVAALEDWLRRERGLSRAAAQRVVYLLLEHNAVIERSFAARFVDTLLDLPAGHGSADGATPEQSFQSLLAVAARAVSGPATPANSAAIGQVPTEEPEPEQFLPIPLEAGKVTPLITLPLGVGDSTRGASLRNALYTLISGASRELLLASPFLDDGGLNLLWSAFEAAAARNVILRLLVKIDNPTAPAKRFLHAYRRLHELFDARIRIRSYARYYASPRSGLLPANAGGVHSKLLIADQRVLYLGSGEITASALTTNFETGILATGSALVQYYARAFALVWDQAEELTSDWIGARITTLQGFAGR